MGAPQDLGGPAHVTRPEELAHPGGRPAAPRGGAHVGDDLHGQAVGTTYPPQSRRITAITAPEAHVVAHDDRPRPEQLLEPGAHELLGALVGEVEGVGDHEDGVQAGGRQGREPVRQGGDHGQVGLGVVNQHRVRVEGHGHRQRPGAPRPAGPLDNPAQDRLMPAVHAVEDADGHHAARPTRRTQTRGHLLGAVPDLHCGQSCSRSTRRNDHRSCGSTLPRADRAARAAARGSLSQRISGDGITGVRAARGPLPPRPGRAGRRPTGGPGRPG